MIRKGFDHIAALGVGPEIQFHVVCRLILKMEDSTSLAVCYRAWRYIDLAVPFRHYEPASITCVATGRIFGPPPGVQSITNYLEELNQLKNNVE